MICPKCNGKPFTNIEENGEKYVLFCTYCDNTGYVFSVEDVLNFKPSKKLTSKYRRKHTVPITYNRYK